MHHSSKTPSGQADVIQPAIASSFRYEANPFLCLSRVPSPPSVSCVGDVMEEAYYTRKEVSILHISLVFTLSSSGTRVPVRQQPDYYRGDPPNRRGY